MTSSCDFHRLLFLPCHYFTISKEEFFILNVNVNGFGKVSCGDIRELDLNYNYICEKELKFLVNLIPEKIKKQNDKIIIIIIIAIINGRISL